jgi:hypothetical protein
MIDSGELYTGMEVDDDLSSATGTETLIDRDLIPPGFDNARRAQIINGLIQEFPFGLWILLLYLQSPANARESSAVPKTC